MSKRRNKLHTLQSKQRSVSQTVRTATFGVERPRRWVGNFLRRAAEVIEPRESDVRMVVPEEPRRSEEPDFAPPHELHSQRDSVNSESRGERPERHSSPIHRE